MTVMWTVVIPVKVLARAKSRLGVLAGTRRPELALAMAADTVSVVLDCPEVAQVIVVTSDEAVRSLLSSFGVTVVGDEPEGLNAALVHGASVALRRWPGTGIAALSADLPALRPAELERALRAAAALPGGASGQAAFVADEQGVGTTLYAAREGVTFQPAFGGESRRRHAAAGVRELLLDGIPGLRRDVDTPADLRTAVALGTGPRTMAVAGDLLRV
jgi:2-phospho-L-lactate guanylyltransferase